ncbi:hypothetical protein, variant 2 [Aphanomyces astaci]|uniref:Histone-lysine N-methyltransferase, H3 lysine-79 specific n=2 Tax=Aphanomyces astaci TaxID=112090 RepID=W4FHN4_APHAT|nr:hypothetical protein, variant 2 [Aphanomyces astaci]ETV66253.1 hypothetical protein, variant 2 [Aphanomyces astaci]|eukprot:XP_009844244.1 hypothetical protein, variant 2 [Aphanomyces astaci]
MPTKHTMWLMQVAASLPVPEKHALKEMVLRGNRRLRSITNVEDVHRVVTIAAVSNAFRAWYTLFDSLAISTDTARYLHQNEHGLHNDDDDDWAASSSASFTYGEVDFFGLASLLAAVRPRPGQTFCDLGHGTGRAVFAAALLYPELRVLGIELVPSLFQASRRAFRAFPCHHHEHSIQLVHGDILHVDWWSGCDFVWVNATAFSATLWNHVQTLALRLQPGAIFVCLTQTMTDTAAFDTVLAQWPVATSWGSELAHAYRRK